MNFVQHLIMYVSKGNYVMKWKDEHAVKWKDEQKS